MAITMPTSDKYIVRWDHPGDQKEYLQLKAGTIVEIMMYYKIARSQGDADPNVCHLANVKEFGVRNPRRGMVRAVFLQPLSEVGFPVSEPGLLMYDNYKIDERLWDCRWFLTSANPVEMAIRLRNDASQPFGSFLLIGVSELDAKTVKCWKQLMLIVKWFSGPLSGFVYEIRKDTRHALLFNNTPATTRDRTKPPPSYSTGVAFIPILRTSNGRFFLEQMENKAFSSVYALISFYMGRGLPLRSATGPPLTLTQPYQILQTAVKGLAPFSSRKMNKPYKQPADCCGLFMYKDMWQNCRKMFGISNEATTKNARSVYGVVSDQAKNAARAIVRPLNKNWFDKAALEADLALLDVKMRCSNDALPPANRNCYYIHGIDYLARIISVSTKTSWPFVAYEFIPNVSLAHALVNGRKFSYRSFLEVLYQVAAAMSHLEVNGLCHRGLCSQNVIIHWEDALSVSVKVTDYMLPNHHLNSSHKGSGALKEALKWQWMAPESIFHGIFDIVADSYSFGCLIFEMWNSGMKPYSFDPKIKAPEDVKKLVLSDEKMTLHPTYDGPTIIKNMFDNCLSDRTTRVPFIRMVKVLNQILFDNLLHPKFDKQKQQNSNNSFDTTGFVIEDTTRQ